MAGPVEKKKRLGDMLVQEGLLTPKQLDQAVEQQRAKGGRLGDILVDQNHCTEDQILSALAKRAGIPFVSSLSAYGRVSADVLSLISGDLARQWGVFPLSREGHRLTVALADPFVELDAVDDLKIHTGYEISMVLTSGREIQKAVESAYPKESKETESEGLSGSSTTPADTQMATMTNALLGNAAKMGAAYIYLEPTPSAVQVRYRIRGQLLKKPSFPLAHYGAFVTHLKGLARMDTADRWLPQDGRLHGVWGGRALDVRVATLPTSDGEKVVLALVDSTQALPMDLAKLGMDAETLLSYQGFLNVTKGLVLVAGPGGSGKTATIYATLAALRSAEKHILTIEDPIERYVDEITQVQARSDLRLTLASGLQVFRRMAPDVVMASDILDVETADAAMETAGECVVLSTITAPDALGAVQKLIEMGVPPSLLSDRLVGVLGQRLVRKICSNCRESHTLSLRELMSAGLGEKEIRGAKRAASFSVFRGRGCGQCLATGYDGAAAVFETFPMTDNVRRLVAEKASPALLARETAERVTLREAAMKKVLAGETSVDEALRVH